MHLTQFCFFFDTPSLSHSSRAENEDELSRDLAEYIAELSEASIKEHGVFAIALSSGSLIYLMRKLCASPHSVIVDWAKWHVFWVDERVVSKSHADSNYRLAKDGFIAKVRINYKHVHSFRSSASAEQAAERYQFDIRQLVKARSIGISWINDSPKFDLVLHEMGLDGHVASLLPNHPALEEKEQWVTFMTDSPEPPPERIAFTFPVINAAVAVIATGGGKAEAVRLAIDEVGADGQDLPVKMVQPVEGKLVWFMDVAAASKLDCAKSSKCVAEDG